MKGISKYLCVDIKDAAKATLDAETSHLQECYEEQVYINKLQAKIDKLKKEGNGAWWELPAEDRMCKALERIALHVIYKYMNRSSFKYRVAIRQDNGSYKRFEVTCICYQPNGDITVDYKDPALPYGGDAKIDSVNAILEQCTGILDNTGVRIYEHDILQDTRNERKYKVAWVGCTAGFVMILLDGEERYNPKSLYFADKSFGWFKIIGNIHERF